MLLDAQQCMSQPHLLALVGVGDRNLPIAITEMLDDMLFHVADDDDELFCSHLGELVETV